MMRDSSSWLAFHEKAGRSLVSSFRFLLQGRRNIVKNVAQIIRR